MYKTSKTYFYICFHLKTSYPDLYSNHCNYQCSNLMHLILGESQMEELKIFFKSSLFLKYTIANARQGLVEMMLIPLYQLEIKKVFPSAVLLFCTFWMLLCNFHSGSSPDRGRTQPSNRLYSKGPMPLLWWRVQHGHSHGEPAQWWGERLPVYISAFPAAPVRSRMTSAWSCHRRWMSSAWSSGN